jgi:hypothetical protein
LLGGVRASHVPPRRRSFSALRLPRRMPAQTLVSLVFGLRCPHRAHGYPRLLGHLLRARRVPRPRRGHRHPVPSGDGWCCSLQGHGTPWTLGSVPFSRLTSHGSLVRVPTHRRARRRPASALSPSCPSQGSLPTCLAGLIGRDSHPLDDASVFLEGHRTSFPYGPALPGRTPAGTGARWHYFDRGSAAGLDHVARPRLDVPAGTGARSHYFDGGFAAGFDHVPLRLARRPS